MRSIFLAAIVLTTGIVIAATTASAEEMTQEQKNYHTLHGLIHMYAAGSVCYYNKRSFSKQESDEMLGKIKEVSKTVPQKTVDEMWAEARDIMAEGQASATPDICAKAHQQYVIGRPYLFGIQPGAGKAL